jgi:hypothetical protein
MRTRTELLVFLTLWCATLQLVVSVQSKNGVTCTSGCSSTITSGTWCYVPSVGGTCPSGSTSGLTGCWDWCGYQYTKTGGFGSCTTKPNGTACGATSGRKQETYKCVDYEANNGDKCSGSAPVSYVDCEKTACPIKCDSQSACGRACCGEANPTCINEGVLAFITANGVKSCSLNEVDCSRCEFELSAELKEAIVNHMVSALTPIVCDSQSACGRACCGEANPTCINEGVLAFTRVNGVTSCSLKGVDCSKCAKQVPKVNVVPNINRASSASFVEPAAGLVTAGFVITLWLSVYKD